MDIGKIPRQQIIAVGAIFNHDVHSSLGFRY